MEWHPHRKDLVPPLSAEPTVSSRKALFVFPLKTTSLANPAAKVPTMRHWDALYRDRKSECLMSSMKNPAEQVLMGYL